MIFSKRIKIGSLFKDETKRHVLIKFLILLLILISYTGYLSHQYGFATGGLLAIITWSFFVLCTPIADAGMLLDFPIRLLFRIRMWLTELIVWCVAIILNMYTLTANPEIYEKSIIGHIFHGILIQPNPYWGIILLSFAGTFLSVHFADELMDLIKHYQVNKSTKHRLVFEGIMMVTIFVLIIAIYNILLNRLGLDINHLE